VTLRSGVTLASTSTSAGLLATLNLGASDPGGAGVRDYDVKRSTDGGAWASIADDLATATLNVTLAPGHSYRFAVRARDRAGNVGSWVTGPSIRGYLSQQTNTAITWKGTWTKVSDPRFSGGSVRYATAAGASMKYSFSGRAIAWVTTFAPSRGAAKVYLDGVLVATVDTYAATTTFGKVAFAKTWASSGFHTIRIVAVGTAVHPRIDVDALEVVR
jgi:hypothetical protein